MARAGDKIYEWDKQPRMPVPTPPRGSCDCQFHIYESPAKFPPRPNPPYPAIESATFGEAQRMHRAIGFDRGVILHSAIYGSDHRLLLHALESLDDRDRYRGIGIVDDRVSDQELARLHAVGVRGARFNQRITVRADLVEWENRLKINYLISDAETGERMTRGSSVQVAVEIATREMLLASPKVFVEAVERALP